MYIFIEPLSQNIDMHVPAYPLPILEIASFVKHQFPYTDIRIISIPVDYGIPIDPQGKTNVYRRITRDIVNLKPKAIGISCTAIAQAKETILLCEKIKEADPDIFIFLGGYFPTIYFEDIFKITSAVDLIVSGEGELSASMIIGNIERQKSPIDSGIPNLVWKEGGALRFSKMGIRFDLRKKSVMNPLLLKHPDEYDIIPYAFSRGCPYQCSFCMEEFIRPNRKKVPRPVIERDLEILCNGRDIKTLLISDALFKSFEYFPLFRSMGLKANFETRCDVLEPSIIPQICDSCGMIALGLESASYNSLKRMNKVRADEHYEFYLKNALEIFRQATNNGIPIMVFMISGYPGDTQNDLDESLVFAKKMADSAGPAGHVFKIGECRVYPKTKLYDYAIGHSEVIFEDKGVFGDNIVRQPSKNLKFENVLSNMKAIFELSNFTPLLNERLTNMMPLFRIPADALRDDIIPGSCFIDVERTIFDVKKRSLEKFKVALPRLRKKFKDQMSGDRSTRSFDF